MQFPGFARAHNFPVKRFLGGLLLSALAQCNSASAQTQPPKIKQFEVFRTALLGGRSSALSLGTTETQRLQVNAFGQTFRLRIQANTELAGGALTLPADLSLIRGTLADKPGSWVRLSYRGSEAEGLIWDGRDLYAVEPVSAVAGMVAADASLPAQGSIVFKLSDTEIPLAADFCGADDAGTNNGLSAYQSVVGELNRMQIAAAGGTFSAGGIEMSLLADAAFRNKYSSTEAAQEAILVRLNNLDGIFGDQLGVRLIASSINVDGVNSLSSSTAASTLLDSLANLRNNSTSLQATGLTHLFTGRNLDGNTVGMAYINTLCNSRYAASLTESRNLGAWLESLIAAHEIGHNLGAIHDSEGSCTSTPTTYLMAPQINGASTFSQCSLNKFATILPAAACVIPLTAANAQLPANLGTTLAAVATPFDWSVSVKNTGDLDAAHVRVSLSLPNDLAVLDSAIQGGSCVGNSGSVICSLDRLNAGTTQTLNLQLSANALGNYSIAATVEADNDSNSTDDAGTGTIEIRDSADLTAAFGATTTIELNAEAKLDFTLHDIGPANATGIVAKLSYPAEMTVSAIELAGTSCTVGALQASCNLPTLTAGDAAAGTIHFRTGTTGTKTVKVEAQSDNYDPAPSNNAMSADVQVTAAASSSSSVAASGGGGGALDWLFLVALAGFMRTGRVLKKDFPVIFQQPARRPAPAPTNE